jgi:hypothetical protein
MRKLVSLSILILVLFGIAFGIAAADARGGRGSDDCPPKSPDPDCK